MPETDTPTGPHRTQKPPRISPETEVAVRLGLLATGAGALVVATIFVWTIKVNGERALEEIRALRSDYNALAAEHRELWWHYTRTSMRAPTTSSAPAGP